MPETRSAASSYLRSDMDADIENQKALFTPEELARLQKYRTKLASHSHTDGNARVLNKSTGAILGAKFDDYYQLISRLKL